VFRDKEAAVSFRTRSREARDDQPRSRQALQRYRLDIVFAAAAVAAMIVVSIWLLAEPDRVGALTIANASDYNLEVEIGPGDHGGWLALPGVPSRATREFRDVLDQGGTWIFAFRAQGRDGGRVMMSRADLRKAGWHVDVPDDVVERLRAAEAPAVRQP
jgi:hypothetical protein